MKIYCYLMLAALCVASNTILYASQAPETPKKQLKRTVVPVLSEELESPEKSPVTSARKKRRLAQKQLDKKLLEEANEQLLLAATEGNVKKIIALYPPSLILEDTSIIKPDINTRDAAFGSTPLMLAARGAHTAAVNVLIEFGANVLLQDNQGYTALMEALAYTHHEKERPKQKLTLAEKVDYLRRKEERHEQQLEIIDILLTEDVKNKLLNAQTNKGMTALSLAVEYDDIAAVKTLIENNADVNLATKEGITPLMLAAHNGNIDMVRTVGDTAKRDLQDSLGQTAYDYTNNVYIKYILAPNKKLRKKLNTKIDILNALDRSINTGHPRERRGGV